MRTGGTFTLPKLLPHHYPLRLPPPLRYLLHLISTTADITGAIILDEIAVDNSTARNTYPMSKLARHRHPAIWIFL